SPPSTLKHVLKNLPVPRLARRSLDQHLQSMDRVHSSQPRNHRRRLLHHRHHLRSTQLHHHNSLRSSCAVDAPMGGQNAAALVHLVGWDVAFWFGCSCFAVHCFERPGELQPRLHYSIPEQEL
ncbi:unnamed protein product, partial [Aureobasidium pullulans]